MDAILDALEAWQTGVVWDSDFKPISIMVTVCASAVCFLQLVFLVMMIYWQQGASDANLLAQSFMYSDLIGTNVGAFKSGEGEMYHEDDLHETTNQNYAF